MEKVKIVEFHYPSITVESDMFGGKAIKFDDFTYVKIDYDYRYTNNAGRSILCDQILDLLGVDPKTVKQTHKGIHMPTIEELDTQIASLTELRDSLLKPK